MTLLFDKIWGKGHRGEGKGIKDDRKLIKWEHKTH